METPQAKILKDITHFLDKSKIPYMITGSWSSINPNNTEKNVNLGREKGV